MPTEHVCRTCKWAEWQRTPTGRIQKRPGRCVYPVVADPVLPIAITRAHMYRPLSTASRNAIWPNDTEECPTWEAAE